MKTQQYMEKTPENIRLRRRSSTEDCISAGAFLRRADLFLRWEIFSVFLKGGAIERHIRLRIKDMDQVPVFC